jgi:formate transporter
LQDIKPPATVGGHILAREPHQQNKEQTANQVTNHTFIEAVALGILANLMVCLAVWMSYSGRSLMDKAMIMVV